jgi:hypothetical protein
MSWTRHDSEQLWSAEKKIECLRDEEEEKGFAEMAENRNNSKSHS